MICRSHAQLCLTLCDPMDCRPPGSCVHGDSPGKNTGVGCHALLQGLSDIPIHKPHKHTQTLTRAGTISEATQFEIH